MSSSSSEWLTTPNGIRYEQPTGLFINNEWLSSKSGDKIIAIDPSTENEITSVHAAGLDDVDLAVRAARDAFNQPSWRNLSGSGRGDLLLKLSMLVEEHRATLASIETWNSGKHDVPFNNLKTSSLGYEHNTCK